jgi:hypothetical protein
MRTGKGSAAFGSPMLAAFGVIGCIATGALAATPFDALLGSWSGSGQIRYEDGRAESVRCSAYYTEGGQRLRLAIRCRSASNEIEVRGLLTQRGDNVAGTWEERTFNVSGEVTGRITSSQLTLAITGGAFSGSMSVSLGGARQTVVIATQGISMRSVNVVLAKS